MFCKVASTYVHVVISKLAHILPDKIANPSFICICFVLTYIKGDTMRGKIYDSKLFYVFISLLALADVLFVLHICCSYEALIRPILPRLVEQNKIGNTVSGANWLAYFTILSNLFVSVWFLLWTAGKLFKSQSLLSFCQNQTVATCVTLYIFVTGLLYTGSTVFGIRWFDSSDGGAVFNNVVNVYHHFIMPPLTMAIYFTMPLSKSESAREVAMTGMLFPMAYLAFSLIRGKAIDWYAYPIFRPEMLWEAVFPTKAYDYATAVCLLLCEMLMLTAFFFLSGFAMTKIQNKRFEKFEVSKGEYVREMPIGSEAQVTDSAN